MYYCVHGTASRSLRSIVSPQPRHCPYSPVPTRRSACWTFRKWVLVLSGSKKGEFLFGRTRGAICNVCLGTLVVMPLQKLRCRSFDDLESEIGGFALEIINLQFAGASGWILPSGRRPYQRSVHRVSTKHLGGASVFCIHKEHMKAESQHQADVQKHGDETMGFPHDSPAHHFRLLPTAERSKSPFTIARRPKTCRQSGRT